MLLNIVMFVLAATRDQVREIVIKSKKDGRPRFETVKDAFHSTGEWIRATSKHSLKGVKPSLVAEPIESCLMSRPVPQNRKIPQLKKNGN